MHIKKIIDSEKSEYEKINNSFGYIFNSYAWSEIYPDKILRLGIYKSDGKLIGGFCIYIDRIFSFKHIKNPPFCPYVGPFYINEYTNHSKSLSFKKKIAAVIAEYLSSYKFSIITISFHPDFIDMQPFYWDKYKVIANYTYKISLLNNIDYIYSRFSTNRKNDISKASKNQFLVKKSTDYNLASRIIGEQYKKKKIRVNSDIINRLGSSYLSSANTIFLISEKDKKMYSYCICIFDDKIAYYLFGGKQKNSKTNHGDGPMLLWESIKTCKEMGIKEFDFEGSMISGVEKYLRGFGPSLYPYYRVNKSNIFFECILKLFRRRYF